MARIHLFELEDQPWFPSAARDGATAFISWLVDRTGMLAALMPTLVQAVEASRATRIIDLCAGAGSPSAAMARALSAGGRAIPVHCTDLFPNQSALSAVAADSDGQVTFEATPVDATAVPADLTGLRTLFNALHHMRPAQARAILRDAHDAGQPIAVFEVVDRRVGNFVLWPLLPVVTLLAVPLLRPFDWRWLLLTYVVPLIPLCVAWDGLVSCFRIYRPPELSGLVAGLDDFEWTIGTVALARTPIRATTLVGIPRLDRVPAPSGGSDSSPVDRRPDQPFLEFSHSG